MDICFILLTLFEVCIWELGWLFLNQFGFMNHEMFSGDDLGEIKCEL